MTTATPMTILYTTPNCSGCERARERLLAAGEEFEERSVMARQDWFDEVLKYSISVPVIVRGDKIEIPRGGCAIT